MNRHELASLMLARYRAEIERVLGTLDAGDLATQTELREARDEIRMEIWVRGRLRHVVTAGMDGVQSQPADR